MIIQNRQKKLKLNTKKKKTLIFKNGPTNKLNRHLHKGDTQMVSKYMKSCSTLCDIREMQINTVRHYYSSIRRAQIQNTDSTKCWPGCRATRTLMHQW